MTERTGEILPEYGSRFRYDRLPCTYESGDRMDKLDQILVPPRLSRGRILFALAIAVAADGLQILLVPIMATFAQSFVDVVAMGLVILVLGFHPLLLPTFIIELIPGVDLIPTWTGCVLAVIALRKRAERKAMPPPVVETDISKQLEQQSPQK